MLNQISYDMSLSLYFKLFLSVCRFLEYFLTISKASEISRLENSYDPPIINTEPHSDQLENTYPQMSKTPCKHFLEKHLLPSVFIFFFVYLNLIRPNGHFRVKGTYPLFPKPIFQRVFSHDNFIEIWYRLFAFTSVYFQTCVNLTAVTSALIINYSFIVFYFSYFHFYWGIIPRHLPMKKNHSSQGG